jgi:predicted DNA-binding transcriptional regulator YafY
MPINKHALVRYKILDRCFRNPGKKFFIEDLIAECDRILLQMDPNSKGISRRQIFEDIAFMESEEGWSIDLIRHREVKRCFYRYAETSFSINNMPLNDVEIHQLNAAIDILTQIKGMPQFGWVNEMVPKLRQGIDGDHNPNAIIEFDNNQYLKGIEHLGQLYNAILYKTPLLIRYQPYDSEVAFDVLLHPYFLKQYNNRWFLFGFNPEKGKYDWNMAIDRIVSITESNNPYIPNTEIEWHEYFEDIIGVTKPENAQTEKLLLHFKGKTGKYMESKPIHGSQKSKWIDENTLEISLKIMINYELERLLLSYADSVIVLEPKSLSTRILNRLNSAVDLLSKG